jgi:diguanylate cyclase (GGDEF)-like protein
LTDGELYSKLWERKRPERHAPAEGAAIYDIPTSATLMSIRVGRILLIDDSLLVQRLVCARLTDEGYEVHVCSDGDEGIRQAHSLNPDVILLDVQMPGADGFEICRRLKSDPETASIPILFLTAQAETRDKVRGLDLGALDYVSKPFDPVELRARVRAAHRIKSLVEMLEREARIDGLTGLHNRRFFDQRLREEVDRCNRYGVGLALMLLDVDRFKAINDGYGHAVGDRVLVETASVLSTVVRSSDMVARVGGEEFAILAPEQSLEQAVYAAERIRRRLGKTTIPYKGSELSVTVSMGVSVRIDKGPDGLMETADLSMYAAKQNGRNRVYFWGPSGPEPSPLAAISRGDGGVAAEC